MQKRIVKALSQLNISLQFSQSENLFEFCKDVLSSNNEDIRKDGVKWIGQLAHILVSEHLVKLIKPLCVIANSDNKDEKVCKNTIESLKRIYSTLPRQSEHSDQITKTLKQCLTGEEKHFYIQTPSFEVVSIYWQEMNESYDQSDIEQPLIPVPDVFYSCCSHHLASDVASSSGQNSRRKF